MRVDGYDVLFSPIDSLRMLPRPATETWPDGVWDLEVWKDTGASLSIFAPRLVDHQGPHDRDELYVVIRGSGTFVCGSTRHDFTAGDVLVVPAGVEHHFERFEDLVTWVVFWDGEGAHALAGQSARTRAAVQGFAEAWLRHDLDAAMAFMAPDAVYSVTSGPEPGRSYRGTDEVRAAFAEAMDDAEGEEVVLAEPIVDGSRAALGWTIVRTPDHGGDAVVTMRGVDLIEVSDGLVVRKEGYRKVALD